MSKAALSPLSVVKSRSLVTLRRAVSVLCNVLKLDRYFSNKLFCAIKVKSWDERTFSKTIDKNESLEIGLKL